MENYLLSELHECLTEQAERLRREYLSELQYISLEQKFEMADTLFRIENGREDQEVFLVDFPY